MRNSPQPLPENLWGATSRYSETVRWRFAAIDAGDLEEVFLKRTIPIRRMPEELSPIRLGLASTIAVAGVVMDGGRRSMQMARWFQSVDPVSLNFIAGAPDGLILEAGAVDRWIVATFEDAEMRSAAELFEQRKQASQGLHFLLIEPDDSGMTYTGFWLLQKQ